jgi:uncharacterized coiled-coil protein SlyX
MTDATETTGQHRTATHEERIAAIEQWRAGVNGARALGTFIAGGVGAVALIVAGAFARDTLDAQQTIAIHDARLGAIEARERDQADQRDAVAEQLGAVAVELGRLRVTIDALDQRMQRMESRLDGARR